MITKAQRRFLFNLEKRGRDFMSIDKRVYASLAKHGLIEGRFSALNDGYVCITPAGKEALEEEIEREAAALWRTDHPDASVFSCDHKTKEKYRKKIRAAFSRSTPGPLSKGEDFRTWWERGLSRS